MPEMTLDEIEALIEERVWGTLIAIDLNKPYGIELAYSFDGEYIYFGFSRPNGRMSKCIRENPNVAFKICDADVMPKSWRAVIVEGEAEKVIEREEIFRVFRSLAKRLELPEDFYASIAESFSSDPANSTLYKLPLKEVGGKYKKVEMKYKKL